MAGSAAILMESLKDKGIPYNSFTIKNILMSTATDLGNDPFSQGAGLVNVTRAVDFVLGNDDVFEVYNDASYYNTKKILDSALKPNELIFSWFEKNPIYQFFTCLKHLGLVED